jgi:hypothetical protein
MRDLRLTLIGGLVPMLLASAPASAPAQTSASASTRATPAAVLKHSLRSIAAAQTRYHAERGKYATSLEQLGLRPEAGVAVEVMVTGATGWQARAIHRDQPGKSCVIFTGRIPGVEAPRTDGDREMAGEDGVPLCDMMR